MRTQQPNIEQGATLTELMEKAREMRTPTEAEKQHACDMQVIRDKERYAFAIADVTDDLIVDLQAKNQALQAHADKLAEALRKLVNRLDNITTDGFAQGAERIEREFARNTLAAWEGNK